MGYPPRLDLPGARHHVMNRGADHAAIFDDDHDCAELLGLLSQLRPDYGVEVHGYALMSNHFHLLVHCPRGGLGRAMQWLQSRYSAHLRRKRGGDGPIWRGRYRNRLVEDDQHWMHLLAYIHLNPVAARLVKTPDDARWTSCRAYYGLDSTPEWLETADLIEAFGSREALAEYTWEVQVGRDVAPDDFDEDALWTRPTSAPIPLREEVGGRWPLTSAEAWRALREVTGKSRASLLAAPPGRGRGNPLRDLALWWLPRAQGVPAAEVARALSLDQAVVSRAAARLPQRMAEDRTLARWVAALEGELPGQDWCSKSSIKRG